MGLINLLESTEHSNNLAHFSAIVNIAKVNGELNEKEEKIIKSFATKLEIREDEYNDILKNSSKYEIVPVNNLEERMEHIYDLLKTINSDGQIDALETKLVLRYTVLLGTPVAKADELIQKSIKIFNGDFYFDEYVQILKLV